MNIKIKFIMSCTCKQQKGLQIVKAGFLRKYKKGFLSKGFKVVYAELTKDCYLLWYKDQTSYKRDGYVQLKDVCDYLAVGPYTRSVPGRPYLPRSMSERHLIAVPSTPSRDSHVYWFICSSDVDLNDWMTCICHVLPPPIIKCPNDMTEFSHDPPPPYPSVVKGQDSSKEEKDVIGETHTSKASGYQVTMMQPSSLMAECAWGWTWGWGGAWGCPGWNYFPFSPSIDVQNATPTPTSSSPFFQESNADLIKNGDLQTNHHQDCQMTDQSYGQTEYDTPDLDPCCDTFCDPSFDATFDAGGAFDLGFSIGF